MNGTSALFDDLGPKGRLIVRVITIISGLALGLLIYKLYGRFESNGQLEANLWTKLLNEDVYGAYGKGLLGTLKAAFVAMILSLIVGAVMALGRLSRRRLINNLAGAYVELFRAWPLLLVIAFFYIGLRYYGLRPSPFASLVAGLTLYNGAMLAEIFRAGILSLDRGQTEAASSLGLSYRQSMLSVVIPQAGRRMLPAMVSQLIALLKDTSLGFVITYPELLREARAIGDYQRLGKPLIVTNTLQALLVAAVIFFLINFALSRLARRLEINQRRATGSTAVQIRGGPEDLTAVPAAPTR